MAEDKKTAFLRAALGADGAEALLKAVRRSPPLAEVLVPRAILSWTMSAASWGYEGPIPGLDNSAAKFRKSETPGLFNGSVRAPGMLVEFNDTTLYRLAAHVSVAIQAEPSVPDARLRGLDLARLGKSIDLLAKAQLLAEARPMRVMSQHGDVEVIHGGVGTKPYFIRRIGDQRMIVDGFATLADAQKMADEKGHVATPNMAPPTPEFDKTERGDYGLDSSHRPSYFWPAARHGATGTIHVNREAWHGGACNPNRGDQCAAARAAGADLNGSSEQGFILAPEHQHLSPGKSFFTSKEALEFVNKQGLGKVELPGQTAKPRAQQGPEEAQPPKMQPRQQRPPEPSSDGKGPGVKAPPRTPEKIKMPTMKVGKSEAHSHRCGICQQTQFKPDGAFRGCLCFASMVADVMVKAEPTYYELTFGSSWDEDARAALLEALHL